MLLHDGVVVYERPLLDAGLEHPRRGLAELGLEARAADHCLRSIGLAEAGAAAAPLPAAKPAAAVRSLAQVLEEAGGDLPEQTRDVFSPSARWITPPTPETAAPQTESFNAQAFARSHRLDAVFSAGTQYHAVINGEVVTPGQIIDGLTLAEIGDRWVVWSGHGLRFRVHLDPQQP